MADKKKSLFARFAGLVSGGQDIVLGSPLSGEVVPLASVKDEAFASGVLGKGAAVLPSKGVLTAPCDGTVDSIPEGKHAVTLIGDNGAEVLIHIGMDTVGLKGAPFTVKVSDGQKVKKGDLLVEFDIEAIKAAGLETVTPIVVANSDDFAEIMPAASGSVQSGDALLTLKRS
jgi:glucose-specific phosphotransferase system IIA component